MPYVIKNPSARKELTFWPCSQARNPGGLRLRRAISLIDGFTWFGGGVVLTTSLATVQYRINKADDVTCVCDGETNEAPYVQPLLAYT